MRYQWHDSGWGAGGWLVMSLTMMAFLAAATVLVVYLVRTTAGSHPARSDARDPSADQAVRILDERFARGEIDAEEYTQRRELLRG
jgi:putative membrane protein